MSWVEMPPCRIVPALNTLLPAIRERMAVRRAPDVSQDSLTEPLLTVPHRYGEVKDYYDYIRGHLSYLYRYHFPVTAFGKWSKVHPFENLTTSQIDDAIVAELRNAGIDPAGWLLTKPHRVSDGNFLKACYHLLNNVLLYFPLEIIPYCRSKVEKWSTDGAYDRGQPSVDETVDGDEWSHYPGYATVGYFKRSRIQNFDRHFRSAFDRSYYAYGMDFTGSWKGRYTTVIRRDLLNPKNGGKEFSEIVDMPGVKEINFTDDKSDMLEWHSDVLRDLEYYKTWGNYQYGYAVLHQDDILTEILIEKNNLPELKYQYLDKLE